MNGVPRQRIAGWILRANRHTRAPASGVVTLVKDFFSGWTVILGHGLGVNSAFLHLDMAAVKVSDAIGRGQLIGLVGATAGHRAAS